jgi:hypothetical protein
MNFSRAGLILLPCPVVAALCASFVVVQASPCLPSAEAVRQDYPGAWPSWTMRTRGHEGEKCWYPSTRATAHDHPNDIAPNDTIEARRSTAEGRAHSGGGSPASLAVLNGANTIGSLPNAESSFAERFAAVTTGDSRDLPLVIRFMLDPVGTGP